MTEGRQYERKATDHQRIHDSGFSQHHIIETIAAFDKRVDNPFFLAPLNSNYVDMEDNLLKITVHMGVSGSGRKSCIRYANRLTRYPIVNINCLIFTTEHQFMNRLFMECTRLLGHELPPYDNVATYNLDSLTPLVKSNILIVVDHCQRLSDVKRQGVLYSLLEWIKNKVGKYVGLHLITTDVKFFEGLEKRVRSRLTSTNFFMFPPDPKAVVEVMLKRATLGCNHAKFTNFLQDFFNSKEFYEFLVKNTFWCSLQVFLEGFKNALSYITPSDLPVFTPMDEQKVSKKLLKELERSIEVMTTSQTVFMVKGTPSAIFSTPALIVLAVIINMIDRKCTINLQSIFRNFVKIKMQLKERQGIGSATEYGEGHITKGLNTLASNGIVTVDEPPDGTVCILMPVAELQQLLREAKDLPPLVGDILKCTAV